MPLSIEEHEQIIANVRKDYEIEIGRLNQKLEATNDEHKKTMEEGFEEAWQLLQVERKRREELEVELYDEYEKKLKDIRDFLVNKVHDFLAHKWEEFVQADMQELADKLDAWRKAITPAEIVDTALEEFQKHEDVDELKEKVKLLEARNIRLQIQNSKLNDHVNRCNELIMEKARGSRGRPRKTAAAPPTQNEVRIE